MLAVRGQGVVPLSRARCLNDNFQTQITACNSSLSRHLNATWPQTTRLQVQDRGNMWKYKTLPNFTCLPKTAFIFSRSAGGTDACLGRQSCDLCSESRGGTFPLTSGCSPVVRGPPARRTRASGTCRASEHFIPGEQLERGS